MVTFVGNQENFADALKELVELEYAAVDAYEAAVERLENPVYKAKLKEFKKDHSTIMYNVNSIEKTMKKDSRLARQVNDIVNNINQHKDNQ